MCSAFFLKAQISIGVDQMPQIGDTLIYSNSIDVDSLDIGNTGANQVWDFRALVSGLENEELYVDPSGDTSGLFTDATIAIAGPAGVTTQFAAVTDTEVRGLGLVSSNFLGFGVEVRLDPTQKLYEIPTNYEDSYTTDYNFGFGLADPQPGIDTARVISTSTDIVEADAYGILRLPQGDFEVLRRKVETTSYLSVEAFLVFFWQPLIQDTTITTSYDFFAIESKRELARVTMDSLGTSIASIEWQAGVDALPAMIPMAAFSSEQSSSTTGQIDFTDESSNGPVSWLWDFGDGNTNTMQNPSHVYTVADDYQVCLTATNSAGSDQSCQTITVDVSAIAPVAAFTYAENASTIGQIDFEDQSTNTPTSWLWDFGDSNTSSVQNPSHVYTVEGNYEVCLFATNDGGTSQTCQSIFVEVDLPIPVAAFAYQDTSVTPGLVHFEDLSTNLPTAWLWDFGDGMMSTEKDPQHTFANDSTYNVCLQASNQFGSSEYCEMLFVNVSYLNVAWNPAWQIGPNPSQGELFVNLNDDYKSGLAVEIYSLQGMQLMTTPFVNNELLNISDLANGNYFLVINDGNKILGSRKIQLIK